MEFSTCRQKILLVAIASAAMLPFAGKAFHIDDPLFLWMAQQIARHPMDPFGFDVNWYTSTEPMFEVMQNPPLLSYYLAFVGRLLGWSELAMHLSLLPITIAALLGVYELGRRLSPAPLFCVLLTLFTPAFLISATTVMCDVMLVAFYSWAIHFWLKGLADRRWPLLLCSALLISAASLTKFYGFSLVPLLATYSLWKERGFSRRLLFLLIPVAAMAIYELLTNHYYGHGHFVGAFIYSKDVTGGASAGFVLSLLTGLAFAGGGIISIVCLAPKLSRRQLAIIGVTVVVLLAASILFLRQRIPGPGAHSFQFLEFAIFSAAGSCILALAIADLWRHRNPESLLLLLWVVGTFVFASFLNWSVTARTFLPMVPAVTILVARRFALEFPIDLLRAALPAAIVSLLLAWSDYALANTARRAASMFHERFKTEVGTVWFQGHWGFQYYMEKWANPFDLSRSYLRSGDVMIIPTNNTNLIPIPKDRVLPVPDRVSFRQFPLLRVFSPQVGAGFYSSVFGPLPWAINWDSSEDYFIARFGVSGPLQSPIDAPR